MKTTLRTLAAAAVSLLMVLGLGSPAHAALTYFYATGQWGWSSGAVPTSGSANIGIWKPTLTAGDFHSLAELAVTSADGQQVVEVGWTVDPALNPNSEPHLFVYWWKNGNPCGYNGAAAPAGCGSVASPWVDYAATSLDVGDELTESTSGVSVSTLKVGIVYSTTDCGSAPNGWWVTAYYSGAAAQYIGCYKDTNWSGTSPAFTDVHQVKAFGEVAANVAGPTTQMGSGVCPAATPVDLTTAKIGSVQTNLGLLSLSFSATDTTKYNKVNVSGSTFYYGGDGSCP